MIDSLILSFVFLAPMAWCYRQDVIPEPQKLLLQAMTIPKQRMLANTRAQIFDEEGHAKAQYRTVRLIPPFYKRIEVMTKKDGPVVFVQVSERQRQYRQWPMKERTWSFPAAPTDWMRQVSDISRLYHLDVSSSSRVAGLSSWRLNLRSRWDHRIRRSYWISKKTGFVLRREDYRPNGHITRRDKVIRINREDRTANQSTEYPPEVMSLSSVPYLNPEKALAVSTAAFRFPSWLPDGYILLQIENDEKNPQSVRAIYTDGIMDIVVEQASQGTLSKNSLTLLGQENISWGSIQMLVSDQMSGIQWSRDGQDHRITGSVSEVDLVLIADSMAYSHP
jgi:hypothetical protein